MLEVSDLPAVLQRVASLEIQVAAHRCSVRQISLSKRRDTISVVKPHPLDLGLQPIRQADTCVHSWPETTSK